MKKNLNIRNRDKISGFISVFVIFSICTSSILYAMLRNSNMNFIHYKDVVEIKTNRQESFRDIQSDMSTECDSLYSRIERFDPQLNAVYEENDIKFLINELKLTYERNMWDKRYKVFYHVSAFYDMWFTDKKVAWSKINNTAMFNKNLEECEIGLQNKSDKLK